MPELKDFRKGKEVIVTGGPGAGYRGKVSRTAFYPAARGKPEMSIVFLCLDVDPDIESPVELQHCELA